MNWEAVGVMVSISAAVSALMAFVVSLMIRSAIAEATNRIMAELHELIKSDYVRREVYERDLIETRRGIEWLESLIEKGGR